MDCIFVKGIRSEVSVMSDDNIGLVNNILTGRRLVVAHNPHSSRSSLVQRDVFDRLDAVGQAYVKLEIKRAPLQDNVNRLAPLIKPGDLVLSAAGDGSAHAIAHALIAADQPDTSIGFLAYGNFNDLPHALNSRESLRDPVEFLSSAQQQLLYPLVVKTNGVVRRHAFLYCTFGWTAKAAARFDEVAVPTAPAKRRPRPVAQSVAAGVVLSGYKEKQLPARAEAQRPTASTDN